MDLSSIIPVEAIRDANDAHGQSTQVQSLGESKQPRGSYVKLTSVQQAKIAKYALANGNGNDKFSRTWLMVLARVLAQLDVYRINFRITHHVLTHHVLTHHVLTHHVRN